jgi:exopolysaccharide production protein ExoZ
MTRLDTRVTHEYPRIQVLRAVAALLVVGVHFTVISKGLLNRDAMNGALAFGASGVDVFFVISGFIMTTVHARDVGRPGQLRPFVLKRLIRIVPLYWLVTEVLLLLEVAGHGERGGPYGTPLVLKSLFFYPQEPGQAVVGVGWTLTYELFFYLMFAALIALNRPARLGLWVIWLGPTLALAAWSLVSGNDVLETHLWAQLVFSERSLEFVLGCVAALAAGRGWVSRPGWLILGGGLAFLVVGVDPWGWNAPERSILVYGIPAALVVAGAATRDATSPSRVPRWGLLVGDASYALYLIHYSLILREFRLLQQHPPLSDAALLLLIAGSTVALCLIAVLIHVWVERPMIRAFRKRFLPTGTEQLVAPPPPSTGPA